MSPPETRVLEDALRLPERARAALAAQLIDSLDPVADADVEAAWAEEIRGRVEELDRGEIRPVPWAEARRLLLDDADVPATDGVSSPRHRGSPPLIGDLA